jgi:hypothetical protein
MANEIYRAKLENEQALLDRFAGVLCNPDELKKSYLATDWMQTVDLVFFSYASYMYSLKKLKRMSHVSQQQKKTRKIDWVILRIL